MKKKKKNKNKIVLGKMTNRLKFLKGALLFLFLVIFIRIGFLIFFDGNYYAGYIDKKTDMTVYGVVLQEVESMIVIIKLSSIM